MSRGNPQGVADRDDSVSVETPAAADRLSVCHVASGDLWAGAEVQIATLLKYLVRDGGLELSAILLNDGRLAEEIRQLGVELLVIPESRIGFLGILRRAAKFLRGRKMHILHSHRYKENLLAAMLALRFQIPHIVQTLHGMPEPQRGVKHLRQSLISTLNRFVSRTAPDWVICVSPEMSRRLRGVTAPHKLVTITNGIDFASVRSCLSAAEAKMRLGILSDHQVLGVAGRLEPIKRLDIFLRAAAKIRAIRADTKFVIAGEGREANNLKLLAESLGIGKHVLFLGHRDDIYDVLRAFDVLVMCSDHEGLPMVLLEALALGLVVVAREVGGIPEVIQDGENGILVKSDDPSALAAACLEVLADAERRRRLADLGPKLVAEGFSAERMAAQVAQLYRSLMESR
jgi:glycosyltransferase involved in cell wall biosynthesis